MKELKIAPNLKRPKARPSLKPPSLVLRGHPIDLTQPRLMGVLNVTPDSFSDGDRYLAPLKALTHLYALLEEGATFVDVGGESSRPGAKPVSVREELRRIEPILSAWSRRPLGILSVDTYKSEVAEAALRHGVALVNDITALRGDRRMAEVIASHHAGVILMHMKGTPRTMQEAPQYTDLIGEVFAVLEQGMDRAIRAGIAEESILLDPGIGFGKTVEQNLEILRSLGRFQALGRPLVLGTSKKSFIGKVLNQPIESRHWGTAATVSFAVAQGVQVLRVHDVAPDASGYPDDGCHPPGASPRHLTPMTA